MRTDEHDIYRGLYERAGSDRAEHYAGCLWQVLALVCEPDSTAYVSVPGVERDEMLRHPEMLERLPLRNDDTWWRPIA